MPKSQNLKTPQKQIYFHVGTAKTGSTFLQNRVFPKLQKIHYIPTNRFKNVFSILAKTSFDKYLISREFDRQMAYEVKKFAAQEPNTQPIIVFRQQHTYAASQYRRVVKNGFQGDFKTFFDLEGNSGFFKRKDFDYCKIVKLLEDSFSQKPLVFLYEDLRANPKAFVQKLAELIHAEINLDAINFNPKHTSYNDQQLKAIYWLAQRINIRKRRVFKSEILHLFWRFFMSSIRYPTLFIAKYLPKSWFSKKDLIPKRELERIKEYYAEDWEACKRLAVKI